MVSAIKGQTECFKLLIQHKADILIADEND